MSELFSRANNPTPKGRSGAHSSPRWDPRPAPAPRAHGSASPRPSRALAQARLGHGGGRGAAPRPVPRRPWQRSRRCAPRRAAGKGRGSGGRRGTAGSRGGPGRRRSASAGPSRRGGGSGVGAPAAAEGAALGRAAFAVRGAGARAALLRPLPALLDVRRHPRPRRAAARRAQRLLRLQPRLRRHRRDADGRAAGAGAALSARRGQVAPGPPGTALCRAGPAATAPRKGLAGRKRGLFLCKTPLAPYCWPRIPRGRPVPNKAVQSLRSGLVSWGRAAVSAAVAWPREAGPGPSCGCQRVSWRVSAPESFATGDRKAGV